MNSRSAVLLWDAARALGQVAKFTSDRTYEDYLADMMRSAVERQMEIAGEALSILRRPDPSTAAQVPDLASVVGFRDVLSHEYWDVDDGVVWRAAKEFAPGLKLLIENLLPPL